MRLITIARGAALAVPLFTLGVVRGQSGDSSRAARGQRVVEGVVAVVAGRPILLSELRRELDRGARAGSAPVWRQRVERYRQARAALSRLIDARLVEHAAKRQGKWPSPDEVTGVVDSIAKTQALSTPALFRAAAAAGWDEHAYRHEVALQIAEQRMLARAVKKQAGGRAGYAKAWEKERKRWLERLRSKTVVELRLAR